MIVFDHVLRQLARPMLRYITGHWPRAPELSSFRRGYAEKQDKLPPLLNALAGTERARPIIVQTMAVATRATALTAEQVAVQQLAAGQPIAFMHVEKTAGTSLTDFLERRFSPTRIELQPPPADEAASGPRRSPTHAYTMVYGHFALPFVRTHEPERQVVTILREPGARILSCYYYWRSRQLSSAVDDVNEATVLAGRVGLLEFLRCRHPVVVDQIDNVYARRLTGLDISAHDGLNGDDALDIVGKALSALDSLAFVGITERFPESIALLSLRFGLVPPQHAPRINVSEQNEIDLPQDYKPVPRETITSEIKTELDRLARFDRLIYGAAVRCFDAMQRRQAVL